MILRQKRRIYLLAKLMIICQRKTLYFLPKGLLIRQKFFYYYLINFMKILSHLVQLFENLLKYKIIHLLGYFINGFIIILLNILMRKQ